VTPYSGAGALEEEVVVAEKVARVDSRAWEVMEVVVPSAYLYGIVE
jgi:hypothetical protein